MILTNKIQCPDGTILESKYTHDYQEHTQADGRVYAVDGGTSYLRRAYSDEEYEELSIESDDHAVIREYRRWGRNYDKDMNRLPATEWILIKDLADDHLDALLLFLGEEHPYYSIFENEIKFRKGELND